MSNRYLTQSYVVSHYDANQNLVWLVPRNPNQPRLALGRRKTIRGGGYPHWYWLPNCQEIQSNLVIHEIRIPKRFTIPRQAYQPLPQAGVAGTGPGPGHGGVAFTDRLKPAWRLAILATAMATVFDEHSQGYLAEAYWLELKQLLPQTPRNSLTGMSPSERSAWRRYLDDPGGAGIGIRRMLEQRLESI